MFESFDNRKIAALFSLRLILRAKAFYSFQQGREAYIAHAHQKQRRLPEQAGASARFGAETETGGVGAPGCAAPAAGPGKGAPQRTGG